MAQNEYVVVNKFFWPTHVVNTFVMVLGFAFCYKQWKILLCATCFQVVAIVFQIFWKYLMNRLDGRVTTLNSYNITLLNIVLELVCLTVPICFTIELISRAEKLTDYFYVAVGLEGAALVMGMIAIVTPRAILLGGAEVYGDLWVFHWDERMRLVRETRSEN